jgi:hypothetical protein
MLGGLPEEGSILAFTTDDRYATIHFGGLMKGQSEPSIFSYPFLGWAVQVNHVNAASGVYRTSLVPVGVGQDGDPVTAWDLETFDDVLPGHAFVRGIDPRHPVQPPTPTSPHQQ